MNIHYEIKKRFVLYLNQDIRLCTFMTNVDGVYNYLIIRYQLSDNYIVYGIHTKL